MSSVLDDATDLTMLLVVGVIGYVVYEFFNNSSDFYKQFAADIQGLEDWFTGDAVYNSDGTRIPLSTEAQTVLNSGNMMPLGVVQTDNPAFPNLVQTYNLDTGGTTYIDPATGNGVT
jgi:hypothetical protein